MNLTELLIFRGCLALSVIAIPVLLWALFGDRARGRPRCPFCWYRMTGVPSRTCPECGKTARRDRDLMHTRRRWRFAVPAALPLLVAYYLFLNVMPAGNWKQLVPNTVLIAWLDARDSDAAWNDLRDRTTVRLDWGEFLFDDVDLYPHFYHADPASMYDWQWRWLHRITIRRLSAARTVDEVLRWRYAATGLPYDRLSDAHHHQTRRAFALFRDHPDPMFRWLFAFPSLEPDDDAEALTLIDSFLDDDHPMLRFLGALHLTLPFGTPDIRITNDERLRGYLTRIARGAVHEDERVRGIVAGAIRTVFPQNNLQAFTPDQLGRIRDAIAPLANDPNLEVRASWLRSHAALIPGDDDAGEFLAGMMRGPSAADAQTLEAILRAATNRSITGPEFIDAAIEALRDLTSPDAPSDYLLLGWSAVEFLVQQSEPALRAHADVLPGIVDRLPAEMRSFAEQLLTVGTPEGTADEGQP